MGNLFFFWRWGKGGREKLFCRRGFWCWFSGLQMCFFLCGGFLSLVCEKWWKNIVYKRKNISFKRSNMIYRCKNMIYKHKNIIYKGKNITFGCANIVLWWKNIKTSQRNIRLGCENIKNGRCNWESSCFNIKWEKWIWLRRRLCIRERLLRRGFLRIFLRFGRWNINLFRRHIKVGLFLWFFGWVRLRFGQRIWWNLLMNLCRCWDLSVSKLHIKTNSVSIYFCFFPQFLEIR